MSDPSAGSSAGPTAAAAADRLRDALKRAASALSAAEVPYAVAGSWALWAHGAPEPVHDVDLIVAEPHTETAADTLGGAGFAIERPPEGWLFKAHFEGAMVDVLHGQRGRPVDVEVLDDAEAMQLFGVWMPVLPATAVVAAKLGAMDEHYCDFARVLPAVRAVREQLDWPAVAAATAGNPFAEAFLFLARRLGVAPAD